MFSRLTVLSSISVVALAACATPQENPYYKYSSKYKGAPTTTVAQAPTTIQSSPVSYEAASYSASQQAGYTRVTHDCLKKEKNHELLGAGIGGSIGAIAGKKLIGGTKGTVIGAGLGGAAGYGIGDKVVNCDPEPVPLQHMSAPAPQSYSAAPTVAASYASPVIAQPYVSPTDTEFSNISETGTPGYQVLQAQTVEVYQAPTTAAPISGSVNSAQEVTYDYADNTIAASANTVTAPFETRVMTGGNYGSHIVKQGDTVYSLSRKLCVSVTDIQSLNNLDGTYGINIGDTLQLPSSNC